MAKADYQLTVGCNANLSIEIRKGINAAVIKLNKNPPKIKVSFDIDKTAIKTLQDEVTKIKNSLSSSGGSVNAGATQYYNALRQIDDSLDITTSEIHWYKRSLNMRETWYNESVMRFYGYTLIMAT